MGQCGCGEFSGRWRMPGPDGGWYVIGPYYGCQDCSTPLGLSIDFMPADELKHWEADRLPIVGGPGHANFGIPVIDLAALEKLIFKAIDNCGVNVGEDEEDREELREELDVQELVKRAAMLTADGFPSKKQTALT